MDDMSGASRARARKMLSATGYGGDGEIHDGQTIAERNMGSKSGGKADGHAAGARPDRRARGGSVKDKHEGGGKIGAVNIAVGNPEKEQMAAAQGKQEGIKQGMMMAKAGAGAGAPGGGMPPPHPPMGGPPPGGMPPPGGGGAPPMGAPPGGGMPPPGGAMMPHKRGGKV